MKMKDKVAKMKVKKVVAPVKHSDAAEDKKMVKKMVKKVALK